ncbi:hypothetical protein [Burkholderia pyrrocinia]|uniref:hypothetical protein n=1 Tax=Burkholderia pyrrocinia TaxID=60550 RepID=UPI0030D367C0
MIGVMSIRLLTGVDLHARANQYTLAAIATQLAFASLARLSGQTRAGMPVSQAPSRDA